MKYTYNSKTYNIPDEEVDAIIDKYECSISEACEAYLTDNDLIINEKVEELNKKASKNRITQTIHGAKGEKKPRKAREKKENPLKKEIIQTVYNAICEKMVENQSISIKNDEKYIDFSIDGREFTLNLVEHRPKKEN